MQEQLTSPSTRKMATDATLYGGHLSIMKFCCAIMLLLVTLAIVFAWNGGYSGSRETVAENELSLGMPLP